MCTVLISAGSPFALEGGVPFLSHSCELLPAIDFPYTLPPPLASSSAFSSLYVRRQDCSTFMNSRGFLSLSFRHVPVVSNVKIPIPDLFIDRVPPWLNEFPEPSCSGFSDLPATVKSDASRLRPLFPGKSPLLLFTEMIFFSRILRYPETMVPGNA